MFFDSHCHLDFPQFDHDRQQVLQRCSDLGVMHILIPGVTASGWPGLLGMLPEGGRHSIKLLAALGLHPMFMADHQPDHLDQLHRVLRGRSSAVVAVGEIGLDYMMPEATWKVQQEYFVEQLKLAKNFDLPVLIHARKSHDQILKLLRQHHFDRGGIVHAFSGSEQQGLRYIERGFYLGVGGAITWPRATRLRGLMSSISLDSLVLETDAPDMVPEFAGGQRNSPEYLPEIAQQLADLRNESVKKIAAQNLRNMHKLLYAQE